MAQFAAHHGRAGASMERSYVGNAIVRWEGLQTWCRVGDEDDVGTRSVPVNPPA